MMGKLVTTIATNVSRQAHKLPLTAPSGPDYGRISISQHRLRVGSDRRLAVRIVTARIVLARIMNTAPLNSSIRVNLRLSVMFTPHSNC